MNENSQVRLRRRRVRFMGVRRSERENGQIGFTCTLEWQGREYIGDAAGERGFAYGLRTAAVATLRAVDEAVGEELGVRVIGVKPIHAFDSDLIVVSLVRDDNPPQKLVGAVVASSDPHTSVGLAVLNALNRVVGNILLTTD